MYVGVCADEALVEHAARQVTEVVLLQRVQVAEVDLGGLGDLAQGDLPQFLSPA
jgi:hypothetical protein